MIQQGQVFKLKAKGPDGQPLWAYRYRVAGRGSERPQVGGFTTRAEAQRALHKVLDRIGPGEGAATMTLGALVDEYLLVHQARARNGGKAALAARQGDCDARGRAPRGALAEAGVRVAADDSGRASLRGDPGAPAGA